MKADWQKRLREILRWPAVAFGAAATAAGTAHAAAGKSDFGLKSHGSDLEPVILPNTLNATATDRYAAHRSHSSHGSHRSHRSSGSGGGYSPTPAPSTPSYSAPTPAPTPAPSTSPPVQQSAPTVIPKPSPQDLSMMVVRVQAALMRLGYYKGDVDGILGPETRSALTAYQKNQGIKQSGRMDVETLTKLGISIP